MKLYLRPVLPVFTSILIIGSLSAQPQPSGGVEAEVTFSHLEFADADLDRGGELGSSRTAMGVGLDWSLGRGEAVGLSLGAAYHDYDFSGPAAFTGGDPWSGVLEYSLSASWRRPVGDAGMIFVSPGITFSGEDGADWDDSGRAGLVASYGYRFSKSLTVGIGAALFTGLEETNAFPVLLFDWRINEAWRLGNAFRAGPAGPAGIELVYAFAPGWEAGIGAGWRSDRFRLDDNGTNPDGIGEVEGVPAFVRFSWTVDEAVRVNFFAGMLFSGEVNVRTSTGGMVGSEDLDSAPIAGLSVTAGF